MIRATCLGALLCLALVGREHIALGSDGLVDPTRPSRAGAGATAEQGVHVQAILDRSGVRVAIVDGKLVRAGDRVANILIEEVMSDGIRYSESGRTTIARLPAIKLAIRRPLPTDHKDMP